MFLEQRDVFGQRRIGQRRIRSTTNLNLFDVSWRLYRNSDGPWARVCYCDLFSKIALFWCCLKSFETGTLVVPEQGRVFVSYQDSSYWCSLKANRGSDGPWVRVDAIKQLKKKTLGKWSWKKLRWRKNVGSWCTINLSTLSVRNWLAFYYKNRVSLFYKNSDLNYKIFLNFSNISLLWFLLEQLYEFQKLRVPGHFLLASSSAAQQQRPPTVVTHYSVVRSCLVFASVCVSVTTQSDSHGQKVLGFAFYFIRDESILARASKPVLGVQAP